MIEWWPCHIWDDTVGSALLQDFYFVLNLIALVILRKAQVHGKASGICDF